MVQTFRYEGEDGSSVSFDPRHFAPLGGNDLLRSRQADYAYPLTIGTNDPEINGSVEHGEATVRAHCIFHRRPAPFALVQGGWQVPAFVLPRQFLVDRSVVSGLGDMHHESTKCNYESFAWWFETMATSPTLLNALPFAWEGSSRRPPTFEEFCDALDEGEREIHEAFPSGRIVQFSDEVRRMNFDMLMSMEPRSKPDRDFLLAVIPLLVHTIAAGKDRNVLERILHEADAAGVERSSLPMVAVLSCLYRDLAGRTPSIGQKLLKPSSRYDAGDAYNAIADLRLLELAALGQAQMKDQSFALLTSDWAMAAFWCEVGLRDFARAEDGTKVTFDITQPLVPRLTVDQMMDVKEVVMGH